LDLLTFRWCSVSSAETGAFEVGLARYSILDPIPPDVAFFVQAVDQRRGHKGREGSMSSSSVL